MGGGATDDGDDEHVTRFHGVGRWPWLDVRQVHAQLDTSAWLLDENQARLSANDGTSSYLRTGKKHAADVSAPLPAGHARLWLSYHEQEPELCSEVYMPPFPFKRCAVDVQQVRSSVLPAISLASSQNQILRVSPPWMGLAGTLHIWSRLDASALTTDPPRVPIVDISVSIGSHSHWPDPFDS